MKHFLYLIIVIVALSIGSLFVLKSPNGKPWLQTADLINLQAISAQLSSVKNSITSKVQSFLHDDTDPQIYRWQDKQGVWHYSDSKSVNNKAWMKPDNLTVIPAIKPLKKVDVINEDKGKNTRSNVSEITSKPSRSNKVKDLINDTNNIQELMNNRTKIIDEQLSQQ